MAKKKIFSSWSSFRTNKVDDEGWRGKWSWRINLDEVLEKDNYVDPESQLDLTYEYSDAKKTVNMTAQTVTEKKSKKRTVVNILRWKPGSRAAAKYVKTPLEAF